MEDHSDFLAIDPLSSIYPVLDRLKIQLILLRLQEQKAKGRHAIRGAHFVKVFSTRMASLLFLTIDLTNP